MPEKDYVIVRNGESQSYSADDFNSFIHKNTHFLNGFWQFWNDTIKKPT